MFSSLLTSWKTSLGGIAAILTGIYQLTLGHQAEGIASIMAGWGLLWARDNNVSSEQAGAK